MPVVQGAAIDACNSMRDSKEARDFVEGYAMEMLDKNDPVQMKVKNAYDKAMIEATITTKAPSYATTSQDLKGVICRAPGWANLSAETREALDMMAHHMAKILNGHNEPENMQDIIAHVKDRT